MQRWSARHRLDHHAATDRRNRLQLLSLRRRGNRVRPVVAQELEDFNRPVKAPTRPVATTRRASSITATSRSALGLNSARGSVSPEPHPFLQQRLRFDRPQATVGRSSERVLRSRFRYARHDESDENQTDGDDAAPTMRSISRPDAAAVRASCDGMSPQWDLRGKPQPNHIGDYLHAWVERVFVRGATRHSTCAVE
jgi:hypothetical protein